MKIAVYQGERDLIKENRKLAEFDLKGIPSMPAGFPKVDINFLLNADGILKIQAIELRSGVKQEVDVKPTYGITDDQVEQMLLDSITHAKDDVSARMLIEARTEEISETTGYVGSLKEALNSGDKDAIHKAIDELNEFTRPFAERLMDVAISHAMKGKSIEGDKDTVLKVLDTARYDSLMVKLANGDKAGRWPVKKSPYPLPGALLPFNRIVAYYGNMYSKNMGVLGQYPPKIMLAKLQAEVKTWEKADPNTPVIPALHYICVTAQADAGNLQVGFSNVQTEIPRLEKYLTMPDVHLGIDPEFSMKEGSVPGKRIGTFDAEDINFVTKYLADLVVMDMDGWGGPDLKKGTYHYFIEQEPVQFTGFKLFYKNDIKNEPHRMLTPKELLDLKPAPIYIQYQ
eukprot:gene776-780_t